MIWCVLTDVSHNTFPRNCSTYWNSTFFDRKKINSCSGMHEEDTVRYCMKGNRVRVAWNILRICYTFLCNMALSPHAILSKCCFFQTLFVFVKIVHLKTNKQLLTNPEIDHTRGRNLCVHFVLMEQLVELKICNLAMPFIIRHSTHNLDINNQKNSKPFTANSNLHTNNKRQYFSFKKRQSVFRFIYYCLW